MNASLPVPARTFIRSTADGRRIEVIGDRVCLDGRPEAARLLPIAEHPNRAAILRAVPEATHMAGRLALSREEARCAQAALDAARTAIDPDPAALAERLRRTAWARAALEGEAQA
ncbi:hypothetical protein [Caldimonas tepidiphila]|uniref:hypothetical protein n=1 Tax=Caldimonas tepidiphila TaxID=2315841 RepID=UPI000E5B1F68|nr:hypothetical protein [Caldimonas tepidiphila]